MKKKFFAKLKNQKNILTKNKDPLITLNFKVGGVKIIDQPIVLTEILEFQSVFCYFGLVLV